MNIKIPELALVVLIGPSGAGKSSFAQKFFKDTEVISSDRCRGLVSDDENSQEATASAFEVLHFIAAKRLAAGRLTVIDATNVQPESRKPLVALAREYHCLPVAIVLDIPERICQDRNKARTDRNFGPHVIRQQASTMHRHLRGLEREGFRHAFVLRSPEDIEALTIVREPLWSDHRGEKGPFDIIGDVHGCLSELTTLLGNLGYQISPSTDDLGGLTASHPNGRKAVFLGDLVDRGPDVPGVLRLAMNMVASGAAFAVPGNHDIKLMRWLRGKGVKPTHGLAESMAQLEGAPGDFKDRVATFIDDLVSHRVLDGGRLVVAHAGMKESMQGRGSGKVREFALYGETTGEVDDYGLPVRLNWAAEYRGKASVVYGHTPTPNAEWLNNTLCIDTGCVFGGKLTALRWPEREIFEVPADRVYYEPVRPLVPEAPSPLTAQQQADTLLDLDDISGKKLIATRLHGQVTIREENAAAAMEVMSRFAVDPRWLIYLPPTMSPSETTKEPGLLEHPHEALDYFAKEGQSQAVCEEKHMGSRAVLVLCQDPSVAKRRFGIETGEAGVCYTRTGRRFFHDENLEKAFLTRVQAAMTASGFWDTHQTDWVCLDCELMPWSLKAHDMLRDQYASVGAAARSALPATISVLESALARGNDVASLLGSTRERLDMAHRYTASYRHYSWEVKSVGDLRLAPFHILATEGKVHTDKNHVWHMESLAALCRSDREMLVATPYQVVDLGDDASRRNAVEWWQNLTGKGGEGMVVKSMDFTTRGRRGLVQPAVKCRGPEYLRIIYGPEYTAEQNLQRLRSRGLSAKRSLALREFALGIEALDRFVARQPLRSVHQCVFGVLALESEPVDPRL